jgi:photosystem II stability/assembly factor-like uncharacterized protein
MKRIVGVAVAALSMCPLTAAVAQGMSLDPLDRPAVVMKDPQHERLLSIASAGRRLVAVGANGLIVLSDDQGQTWAQTYSPVSVTLASVAFATERVGWAVGHSGVILATQDSGRTWVRQFDGRSMLAALRGKSGSEAKTASTGSANVDPVQQLIEDGPDKPLLAVLPRDTRRVLAVGAYGLLLTTDDGGVNWHVRLDLSGAARAKHLYAVRPLGERLIFAGEAGTLCMSDGIGGLLVRKPVPYAGSFFGLVTTSGAGVIAFGLRGHAVRSDDEGQSWYPLDVGVSGSINAGLLLHDGRVLLATESGELRLSDHGGSAFQPITLPVPVSLSDLAETPNGVVAVGSRGITHLQLPLDSPSPELSSWDQRTQ